MTDHSENQDGQLRHILARIKTSGSLGRSPTYGKLLDYLAKTTESGEICSEISVAIEVFGKDENFDVTSDSTVRVYVHNLRKKLEAYYEDAGRNEELRIEIPKGSYRLITSQQQPSERADTLSPIKVPHKRVYTVSAVLLALLILNAVMIFWNGKSFAPTDNQNAFWGGLLSDDKPVMIVIGDYYIFGESTEGADLRLVREFNINSPAELRAQNERLDEFSESRPARYDVGLTYLPRGSAYALSRVQEILTAAGKRPRIAMMSEFTAEDIRANHVIYIGYLSGLSVLESYTFLASRFDIGFSYDELLDTSTGERYSSNLINVEQNHNFIDYGVISSFGGNNDNRIIIIAGTRDAGLMEMSDLALDNQLLEPMELESEQQDALLAVFEVYGFNLTNISSTLIGSENLDQEYIWGG